MSANYHNTAWAELERKLLVARRAPFGWTGFYLTPRGWLVSIMGDTSIRTTLGQGPVHRLVKTLKRITVIETPLIRCVCHWRLATESDVPPGWCRNAIVSRMVLCLIKDKHIDAWYEDERIVIGSSFWSAETVAILPAV